MNESFFDAASGIRRVIEELINQPKVMEQTLIVFFWNNFYQIISPATPVHQLKTPPMIDEAKKVIREHGCEIVEYADHCVKVSARKQSQ